MAPAIPPLTRTALLTGAVLMALVCAAPAHERKLAGALSLVIGWGDEPAFTGARNSVVVAISDQAGPIKTAAAVLSAEVTFGSERVTLPLEPVAGRPHEYHAWLVPTRAGTYTFRITGKVGSQPVDVSSTCSDSTFHCVADAADIQFPARDPSVAQLSDRIERGLPRAERASEAAAGATRLAIAALATSLLSVAIAIAVAWRGRNLRP
jgi:hypothetical protein